MQDLEAIKKHYKMTKIHNNEANAVISTKKK